MNVSVQQISENIRKVLAFASDLTLNKLKGLEPSKDQISMIKIPCKILADAGVYPFDTEKNDDELIAQIQTFANNVDG